VSILNRYITETPSARAGAPARQDLNVVKLIRDVVIGVVLLIAVLILNPITSVSTGTRGVVTNGGAITKIEPEGRHLVWFWEHLQIFSIRAETAKIDNAVGGTSDQQPVTTSLVVRYSIEPNKVAEVYEKYSHDGDLSSYVDSATHETFKAVTAKYTAPDLLNKRQEVSNEVRTLLAAKLAVYGAQVIQVDMTKFEYDPLYQKAINEKVQQDQLLQTATKRQLTVAAEQQSNVEIAQKAADAVRARADGDAYALLKNATAQADALKVQNAALAQNRDVLELRRIEVEMEKAKKWDGKLPENIYAGAPIPFLNTPVQTK
jgi:regulator of protease activity HflC (stomatin/prohibitin superfamily)